MKTERQSQLEKLAYPPTGEGTALFGGRSKEFFATKDPHIYKVVFNDAMHGRGETREVLGTGRLREEFCYYFYRLLEKEGIQTQIAGQIGSIKLEGDEALLERGILVRRLDMIALELIARFIARGNWVDEHKFPVFAAGENLSPPVVEMCLKWKKDVPNLDYQKLPILWKTLHSALSKTPFGKILMPTTIERDDPRINEDVALALHKYALDKRIKGHLVENLGEWEYLKTLTLTVNSILADFMKSQGWVLADGKFEVGVIPEDASRKMFVGDEYTQDSSRVERRDGTSLTKDLHRQRKSDQEIYDGYAQLTEAMKQYAK